MCNFKEMMVRVMRQHKEEFWELREAAIPQIIHRIWLGRAMPEKTFEVLKHFQEHMQKVESPYTHILWVHSVRDGMLNEQIGRLHESGMEIHDMNEVWDACPKTKMALEEQINMGEENSAHYKHASDIFRMYILYIQGGFYMDADIDVRNERFADPVFHRFRFEDGSYMPLLGSGSPFINLFKEADEDMEVYMGLEFNAYLSNEYAWNYFFASVPENPVIKEMLSDACKADGQTMTVNLVDRLFKEIPGTKEEKRRALFDHAFAPLDLQYCTEASVEK